VVAVSVVLCTRNRADPLRDCLASISAQDRVDGEFEVIIVDNGSTDDTAPVARTWLSTASHGRYLFEPRVGVANARNTGLAASEAEIVAFLDDDVRPDRDWIKRMLDAHHRHPASVAIGGPITLDWGGSRPGWMRPEFDGWYSGFDMGSCERILEPPATLFGANLSVRRAPAEQVGGFDPSLGRAGRSLLSGEEGALIDRLRCLGDVVYDPDVHVTHEVLSERRKRRWLLRRGYAQGRTDVRRGRVVDPASRLLLQSVRNVGRLRSDGLSDVVRRATIIGRAREVMARP